MTETATTTALHLKYRPSVLSEVIGHEKVVTALQGIVKSGKYPSALAFFGPPSAGKTTLARCLAADTLGVSAINGPDFTYINMGDNRTIDDVRQLIATARLSPLGGKRRFILLDEVQAILGNAAAAACLSAETTVITDKGPIPAKELHERIQQGEHICALSFNHRTGKTEYQRIEASAARDNSKPMLGVNGKMARLTSDHRLFSEENGYVNAESADGLTGIAVKTE